MDHDVWVEVNISALKHNFAQVRKTVSDGAKIVAVVKGNGFGHGFAGPSKAFIEAGADMLAVTRLDEAMIIRNAGIDAPILLFAPIQSANVTTALESNLELTVSSLDLANAISEASVKCSKTARIHIKVDTGMGRLGAAAGEIVEVAKSISVLPGLEIAGIYTHFATAAEPDLSKTRRQLSVFQSVLEDLKKAGVDFGLAHAANSAAILRLPESHLGMVRPGTLLYGQYPSSSVPRNLDLKPTWRLRARICEIKDLPRGTAVGYGGEFVTSRPTRAAVVPTGYADGFTLSPEGPIYRQSILKFAVRKSKRKLAMEIRGKQAPVIGRVAMQMCVIDVTAIPDAQIGDEVIIPALRIPTSALIPRVYI